MPEGPAIQSLPFLTAAEQFAGPPIASVRFKNASALVDEPLPAEAIATLVDHLRAAPFASNLVGFFPLGGAIAAVDPAATAFPHRRALFDLQYQAYWWDDAAEPGVPLLGSRPACRNSAVRDWRLCQLHRRRPAGLGHCVLRSEPRAAHAGKGPVRSGRHIRRPAEHPLRLPLRGRRTGVAGRRLRSERPAGDTVSSCDSSSRCSNRARRRGRRRWCLCSDPWRSHTSP